MEHKQTDAVDAVIASFRKHGVIGLVALLCGGLGAGGAAWIASQTILDAVPQSGNEAALIVSTESDGANQPVQTEPPIRDAIEVPPYVTPTTAPTARIELIGDAVVYVGSGESYTDDGAVVIGATGVEERVMRTYVNDIRVDTIVIDTSMPGTHEIEFRTEDTEGNSISTTRTVVVE
jgi:hypothetical protein